MQFTLAALALVAATAVSAQGVTSIVSPSAPAPSGCASTYPGNFEISVVLPNKKRDIQKRDACAGSGTLVANLAGGVLHDAVGRIGAIVANHQFQFDGPPAQAGTIYNAGWSVCGNGSLALGGSAIFYQCLSGTFYNLYDQSIGGQCQAVLIQVIPCTVGGGISTGADGQPTAGAATSARVSQQSDGQPTAASAKTVVTQISDGQIQATSARTVVSQISDGQIQATSARPIVPVSQFTDGQIQATAKATVVASQISDGQVQVTTAAAASSSKSAVVQISDGQIQNSAPLTTITTAPSTPTTTANATKTPATTSAIFSGSASYLSIGSQFVLGAAALVAVAML